MDYTEAGLWHAYCFMTVMEHHNDLMAMAREQEEQGNIAEAGALYEKIFAEDALNGQAVNRLLIMYRKLKQYRKEMQLLNAAIKANTGRVQQQQQAWSKKHPKAARASRSLLRSLGTKTRRTSAMPQYEEAIVATWRKRKENLAKKLAK